MKRIALIVFCALAIGPATAAAAAGAAIPRARACALPSA